MAEAVLIEKAYIKLTENRYPKGATKAARRSIRKKAETLTFIDGVPYHQKKNGKKVGFQCISLTGYKLQYNLLDKHLEGRTNPYFLSQKGLLSVVP